MFEVLTEVATFTPASSEQITGVLNIFSLVYEWFIGKVGVLLQFMLSNPYLMISLGIVTLMALLVFLQRIVHI